MDQQQESERLNPLLKVIDELEWCKVLAVNMLHLDLMHLISRNRVKMN